MLKKKKKEDEQTSVDTNEQLSDDSQTVSDAILEEKEQQIQEEISAEERLKAELAQANDKYLRLYAEFDNFRRRTSKERIELLQTAGKEVITSLLPVLDDFERALKAMETATDVVPVKEGVALVQNKLNHILSSKGLKPMEAKGQVFDADLHEGITSIPAGDDLKGKVVDELEKGYYLNDKVVRFAKVVVGN
ncbi:Protein grpE [Mucilaginibacter paludis DSM 18603]|uniref:Protein GrpE n=2 Tax=Mucilaginibacter TaxID=423349 RepID=H1Y7J4_9SPHI|nr:Protein grpE [Mucilaginibacter paludis DSM 18603]